MPYILGHIFEPSEYEQKIAWFNSNDIVYGLICLTISEDILYHIEHTECPFTAWTIIRQLYGDVDSSSESDDSLDNHTSMGDTKISVASSCVNTSFVDDQFIDDLGASVVSSEIRVASSKASNVSLQQDHLCLPDPVHWDRFLPDISFLFVESLILDLDDSIDFIHLLFDEGDSSLVFVREPHGPLLPSLHSHSSQIDMSLNTFAQHSEEIYLPFEVKNVSFDYVLQQFL